MARGDNFRKFEGEWSRKIDDGGVIRMPAHDSVIMSHGIFETHFHNYLPRRGTYYATWAPFIERIKRKKKLDSRTVYELAYRYDIQKITKYIGGITRGDHNE